MPSLSPFAKSGIFRASSVFVLSEALFFTAGCNNTCFFGVVNPPNNSITVVGGNVLPPVCSLSQPKAAVKVVGSMVPACNECSASQKLGHVYLYISGIELHPGAVADENSADWQELAPELAKQPQLVDLVEGAGSGDLTPRFDVAGHIAAGTYYQLRLRLAEGAAASQFGPTEFLAANSCAASGHGSCLVNSDGTIQALQTQTGIEYLPVQSTSPLEVRQGRLNQIHIQFYPEWSLRKTPTGSVELAPFIQGEIVGNANLPIGALK